MLDAFKKNVFYGKDIDWKAAGDAIHEIAYISLSQYSTDKGLRAELDIDPRVFHALIGVATEATELMEALSEDKLDYVNILEEFGDINWYEAIGIDAMNGNFEKVLTTNIEKLRKRFPEKFTSEDAIERNLDEERNTLESGLET